MSISINEWFGGDDRPCDNNAAFQGDDYDHDYAIRMHNREARPWATMRRAARLTKEVAALRAELDAFHKAPALTTPIGLAPDAVNRKRVGMFAERAAVVRFLREEVAKLEVYEDGEWCEWCDEETGDDGRARLRDKASILRTEAAYIERGDHVAMAASSEPPALTPEVVLRAMLRAYEAAALDAEIAVQSVQKDSPAQTAASNRARLLTTQCGAIRREAAGVIAGWPDEVDFYTPGSQPVNSGVLAGDYEARLAGTRPLDAPPLEAP